MKRLSIILASGLAWSVSGGHAFAESESMPPAVQTCISANAKKVELVFDDLTSASEFLTTSVCAAPLFDWEQSLKEAKQKEALLKERCSNPLDGSLLSECEDFEPFVDSHIRMFTGDDPSFSEVRRTFAYASSAASLELLNLRIERLNAESPTGTK